jgi:translation initiation factor IF-2
MLAIASKGIIIAFNTTVEPGAQRLSEQEGIDLRQYNVIYNVTEDVEKALQGLLEPVYVDRVTAHLEVREVFDLRRRGKVAGCYVQDGTISRNDKVHVLRGGEVVADTKIDSLRRFQEDVREVQQNFECGVMLEGFNDLQTGDVLESYRRERQS